MKHNTMVTVTQRHPEARLVVYAWIPVALKKEVQKLAISHNTTLNEIVVDALQNWVLQQAPVRRKKAS